MKTKAYVWNEIDCEIYAYDINLPKGLTARQTLVLADDQIGQQTDEGDLGTHSRTVRRRNGVLIMDAKFGEHDHQLRMYICLTDSNKAKKLAEKEADS